MRLQSNDSAFFPQRLEVATGIEVELPPFTLRKDERVRYVLKKVLERDEIGIPAAVISDNIIVRTLGLALTRAYDDLLDIGSLILERDVDWIENNCDTADLVELVGSFVLSPVDPDDQDRVESGEVWTLARLVDFMASEYSWTVDDVLDRTRWELRAILEAAADRYDERNRQMEKNSGGRRGKRQFVRPARRKKMTAKQSEESVNALRAFAQSRGIYEKVGGD